jgi:hypothetical protein
LFDFYHLGDFIMRWRDIRFEQPTEADGDECGQVLQMLECGSIGSYAWKHIVRCIAWMPLSELPAFNRIPDPPEGWRLVEKGEAFDERAMFWHEHTKSFIEATITYYITGNTYIVPIDPPKPPEPQYRPFANAAEFEQWATLLFWRYKQDSDSTRRPPSSYSDDHHHGDKWDYSLANKVFADGSPFGVKVEQ